MRAVHNRRSSSTPGAGDPDGAVFRRATRDIAVSIAVLSAVMVIGETILLFAAVWISAGKHGLRDPQTGFLLVQLDPVDAVKLVVIVTIGTVVLAGTATVLLVRRAVRPLQEAMRHQRVFVADASHELRTPLAVMSARTQQLAIMAEGGVNLGPVISDLHADVASMTDIVNGMLASVTGTGASESTSTLWPIVQDTVESMGMLAVELEVRLVIVESDTNVRTAQVALPPVHLRRVLTSIIDNAIGHSPRGSTVEVETRVEDGFVTLRVIDHGQGITGIAPERVFDRFAHGAPAPSGAETISSHGIGLALVRDVVTSHGGSVEVEQTGMSGSVFRLCLPLADHPPQSKPESGTDEH